MERLVEVLGSLTTLLNILVLMFVYLFPCKTGTNVCVEILGNKKLSTLMECLDFFFGGSIVILTRSLYKSFSQ
jgi:hypothetical protein